MSLSLIALSKPAPLSCVSMGLTSVTICYFALEVAEEKPSEAGDVGGMGNQAERICLP